jgi:hypothetical protein
MNDPNTRVVPVIAPGCRFGRTTGITRPVLKGDTYLSNVIDAGFVARDDSTVSYEILECFDGRRRADCEG